MYIVIRVGDVYYHHRHIEKRYQVIAIAGEHSTDKEYPVTIVYKGLHNGHVWCKSLENWLITMKKEG